MHRKKGLGPKKIYHCETPTRKSSFQVSHLNAEVIDIGIGADSLLVSLFLFLGQVRSG